MTARPSRDLIIAAKQQITRDWWETRAGNEDLCISQLVLDEALLGDKTAAQKRLAALAGIKLVPMTEPAKYLAMEIVKLNLLPPKAEADAAHIAICAVNEIHHLLTWNCTHIANDDIYPRIRLLLQKQNFYAPEIYTPFDLLGE